MTTDMVIYLARHSFVFEALYQMEGLDLKSNMLRYFPFNIVEVETR